MYRYVIIYNLCSNQIRSMCKDYLYTDLGEHSTENELYAIRCRYYFTWHKVSILQSASTMLYYYVQTYFLRPIFWPIYGQKLVPLWFNTTLFLRPWCNSLIKQSINPYTLNHPHSSQCTYIISIMRNRVYNMYSKEIINTKHTKI